MNKLINGALQKISRYKEFPIVNWLKIGKSLMNVDLIGVGYDNEVNPYQKTIFLYEGDDIPLISEEWDKRKNSWSLLMYDLTYVKNPNYYINTLKKYNNISFCINLTKRYNIKNMNDFYLISNYTSSTSILDDLLFAELIKYDSLLYTNSI